MRISFGAGRCAERTFLMAKRDRSTKEMRWIKRVDFFDKETSG